MNLIGAHVRAGEIWKPCDPRAHYLVRVTEVSATRVEVVDAATGKRPRSILRQEFHDNPDTKHGAPRRTGFICVRSAPVPTPEDRLKDATRLVMNAKKDPDRVHVHTFLSQLTGALNPLPF
ncbi:hypothetical protein NE857_09345 [Nocardiopsis exhalans]|uniref:Uncharacterized protein n=1 Tax=Nocardiopsis exhalans TaxID=163604 RepID=A0ABY5DDE6_9ACTN|nr:hypothetical protein [Nocardiopsis exhalans]USY21786.1 hypothetical protein NE857_09345 [Nocardiopsis exhalans]